MGNSAAFHVSVSPAAGSAAREGWEIATTPMAKRMSDVINSGVPSPQNPTLSRSGQS